jgi:endonuclease/exonuclease/phosphatase family metal-dependent hydrolase
VAVRSLVVAVAVALAAAACSGDDTGPAREPTAPAAPTVTGEATVTAPAQPPAATVRAVSQNILHGIACAPDSDLCSLPDRVALFTRQLEEAGCPELVSLQETNAAMLDLFEPELAAICGGAYAIVYDGDPGIDREAVLTTLEVLASQRVRLAGPLRTAYAVRVRAPVGIVEFVTSHLASSADDRPCDAATCPPPCDASDSVNTCQGRQLVAFADAVALDGDVVILGGDLNARPDEPTIAAIRDAGFLDGHVEAGLPECDPATGEQCTSGRADDSLDDMTDPQSRQSERIDYLFFRTDRECSVGEPTGLFNGEPATGDPAGLAFPADHTGVQLTLSCVTTPEQRDADAPGDPLPVPDFLTPVTAPSGGAVDVDPETEAAITTAFETLFNGDVTDIEEKLSYLEDADLLREAFVARFEAVQDIAPLIRVRIDAIGAVDGDRAPVTYSLLLEEAVVLDHLPGEAVLVDGRWLVSRRTYCEVATQGEPEIPEPCRS